MHDTDKNNKPIKCNACGSMSSVKKISAHDKLYYTGLYNLYQMPIGIDRIISEHQYHCTKCGYEW